MAAVLRVPDCIRNGIRPAVPQPTEWQRIGNYIDAAMILSDSAICNSSAINRDSSLMTQVPSDAIDWGVESWMLRDERCPNGK